MFLHFLPIDGTVFDVIMSLKMSRRERTGMKQRSNLYSVSLYLSAVTENAARFFEGLFFWFFGFSFTCLPIRKKQLA